MNHDVPVEAGKFRDIFTLVSFIFYDYMPHQHFQPIVPHPPLEKATPLSKLQ